MPNPNPKGDRYYGRTAEIYNRKRRRQGWWHIEHEQMAELLDQLPRDLAVVDIPFGTGRFVPLYRERNYSISGVEISQDMIDAAAADLGDAFDGIDARAASAFDVPFDDAQFDLLVSTRFLSNIITFKDAKVALSEFARIVKIGGHGIIQLGHNTGETRMPDENETMDTCMAIEDVDAMLRAAGFEPKERRKVLDGPAENGEMHHILCERIAI
ncbi:class I SAM-dependent methyltransferase [Pontivivens insulae]|uniref:Ubiquinone/menaquinone biosynthesis C-methyltransferase UbiE n=1 Tax=Pontivivens insulae TaxID=1639689 RepID=A0A2R8A7X7_9RHOB|nr:class I SAM-dependent methyltransferase [Pontivivens insulae]RED18433.1 methyltransferase family protein [Pontivivens insulae]SPF28331.1 Ubiquinone/menaquinone biosynthesis C-methyltransferase UbiE [Pontivivens insulae]